MGVLTLIAIALVHSENRTATAITMVIFASAAAVCLLLIASHDRPFSDPFAAKPNALVQVMPGPG